MLQSLEREVGVMVRKQCQKVVEVRRVSDNVMTVLLFILDVLRLSYECAPEGGRNFEGKEYFYDELRNVCDMCFL